MRQEPSRQKAELSYETRAKMAKGKAKLIENSDLAEVSSLSENYFLDPG